MGAITLTVLDNADLKISVDDRKEFEDICSKHFCDERLYLDEMLDSAGYIGNNWECAFYIGFSEAPAIAQGLIYSENNDDGYPEDYENLWYFKNYMIDSYIEILQETGEVIFSRHIDNLIKTKAV